MRKRTCARRPSSRATARTRSISRRAVERDARADARRPARAARASCRVPLTEISCGGTPPAQRGVQLGRAEDVAAEPLLRERAAQRERVVGLDRRQHARRALGPGRRERAREAPRVAAQLILGDDRERRAEALGERRDVAALDLQAPAGDGEAVVDPLSGRRPRGDSMRSPTGLFRCSYRPLVRWGHQANDTKEVPRMNVIRTPAGKLRRRAAHRRRRARGTRRRRCCGRRIARTPASPQAQTSAIAADAAGQLGVTHARR